MFRNAIRAALLLAALIVPPVVHAAVYPGDAALIGAITRQIAGENDSLIEIARQQDLGFNAIAAANPGLDPFVPGAGASVMVPSAWLVPAAAAAGGLVINLSEMRLYYPFTVGTTRLMATFPIGIGDEGTETPLGTFRVREKIVAPSWHVPLSVRREKPELPAVVPPGPDNPLGSHALRISTDGVMIHGTNKPWGVGREVSHGCIRLYPEDVPRLFKLVSAGGRVTIVREPVKVGVQGGRVYVEVHRDSRVEGNYFEQAIQLLARQGVLGRVSSSRLLQATRELRGMPVDVTR